MTDYFIGHTAEARLFIFIGILFFMLGLESIIYFKKSPSVAARIRHVSHNFFMSLLNTLILRVVLPSGLVGIALFTEQHDIGLFNHFSLSTLIEVLLSIIFLDFLIYWQHRLMHTIPLLWKLHGVHHSDQFMDVSTGFRFHPLEMLFSFAIKISLVLILGISPLAIILFEIILSSFSLFSHSNIIFPNKVERLLHSVWVTPAMHRIHHSIDMRESNMNFGFSVNCWDRLFASFEKPKADQSYLIFGRTENKQLINSSNLPNMLSEPFKKKLKAS